jgi:hypothetical protein
MMIGSVGTGFNAAAYVANAGMKQKTTSTGVDNSIASASKPDAKAEFQKYMKMTPAERMEENWLRAHGLSKEKLAAMSSEDREKIMKQMKDDIEKKLKDDSEQKATKVDITA